MNKMQGNGKHGMNKLYSRQLILAPSILSDACIAVFNPLHLQIIFPLYIHQSQPSDDDAPACMHPLFCPPGPPPQNHLTVQYCLPIAYCLLILPPSYNTTISSNNLWQDRHANAHSVSMNPWYKWDGISSKMGVRRMARLSRRKQREEIYSQLGDQG